MATHRTELTAVLLVATLLASGVAGASLGGIATDATTGEVTSGAAPSDATPAADTQEGELTEKSACAATPPADLSDPESDVLGWENGYWYNESIDVNQSDGVVEEEQNAIVSRTMARVEFVRCIEFNRTVPVSVISREEFRQRQLKRNTTDRLRTFDNVKFEALFLINESVDSIEVQNRNAAGGVLGYYDPKRDEIVVIAESTKTLRIDELTLAHELVHAWQDATFNITAQPFGVKLRDQVNARNGLIEGDASYTETLYERRCGEFWTCLKPETGQAAPQLANIGVYLLKFQPYSDGPAFIRMVQAVGGWEAVNELYAQPPASTEQVIHPERYAGDAPTNVTFNDTATSGWARINPPNRPGFGQLGEAALMMMFVYPYYHSRGQTNIIPPAEWFNRNETGNITSLDPLNYQSDFSVGWDGDELHVYRNDTGALGYVWQLSFDSPEDARQFLEGYRKVLRYWGGEELGPNTWRIAEGGFADAFYVRMQGHNVTIVNAPTVGQLTEIRPGIEPAVVDGGQTTATNETTPPAGKTNATATDETTTANATTANETA